MDPVRALALCLLLLAACGEPESPSIVPSGLLDAGGGGGEVDAGRADAGTVVYVGGRSHSPLTPGLVQGLKAIAARGPQLHDDRLLKAGASNTVATGFLTCFASNDVDLAQQSALQTTVDLFRGDSADPFSSWDRTSLAAKVGVQASWAVTGTPSPIDQELAATQARFALLLFGTNDIGDGSGSESTVLRDWAHDTFTLVDRLTAAGVIPVMSTLPGRNDKPEAELRTTHLNLLARAIAQSRQVPFIELYDALQILPTRGLGTDGIHLEAWGSRPCAFVANGLQHGLNVRNLLNLQAMDRLRRAVTLGLFPDATATTPHLAGSGLASDPFVIPSFPFGDVRDTRSFGESRIASYPGCSVIQNEGGNEVTYRFHLDAKRKVRALVVGRPGSDPDVHLLDRAGDGASCRVRNDFSVATELDAGDHFLVIDTFVPAGGVAQPGEYAVGLDLE